MNGVSAAHEGLLSRPSSKAGRTQRIVLGLLLKHRDEDALPTSPRFIFYELEQRGDATKPSPDDRRTNKRRNRGWPPGEADVGSALTHLRNTGIVPWSWISDETRRVSIWSHAETVAAYMSDRLAEATINPWDGAPPLILCESKATAGVLGRVAGQYSCPIAGTGGQANGFLRTEIAPLLDDDRPVFYLGDLDRCGGDIETNTLRVLEHETGWGLEWERLAVTAEQAAERGIEPIWKTDGRDGKGHEAWEVEALGQAALVALVREALDDLLPEPLEDVREREETERAKVRELLGPPSGEATS